MAPLLKNLLGNSSKDRQTAEEMRAVLLEMQQERERYQVLVERARAAAERLQQLGEPIAKAGSDVDAVAARIGDVEQRFAAVSQLLPRFEALGERADTLEQDQGRTGTQIHDTLEEARRLGSKFEEIGHKVDLALGLEDRLRAFMEVDKPFQHIQGDADSLRGQLEGTGDHLARLREQHDRLLDAHKLAMAKMEALDRRREELSRDLQDKERRVASVDQALKGMDGVQGTVAEIKREMGTLKALGDFVAQKTTALESQRANVDSALARADQLERAMRQINAGVQQQQDNEKALAALQDQVASLRSLHELAVQRSAEISELQREADDKARAARENLVLLQDEMKNTVDRFDFESRGLESVSQRVTDLRRALSDFETRYKGLNEQGLAVAELKSQTQALSERVLLLSDEAARVDGEMVKLEAIRRDLDATGRTAGELGTQMTRIAELRPAVETALRDLQGLHGAHANVKDALEQTQIAHAELARVREGQAEIRSWLATVEQSLAERKGQMVELDRAGPTIEFVRGQAQRVEESMAAIASRQEFLGTLERRMSDLAATCVDLDERGRQLQARMEAADKRFLGLAAHAEEAERLGKGIAAVSSQVKEAQERAREVETLVALGAARCESVEALAEQTQSLRQEIDQRHHALEEAKKDLRAASKLRSEAAGSAQKLDQLAKGLTGALSSAGQQVSQVEDLTTRLEDRAAQLRSVDRRLGQFEERLAKWELVEQEITRSLEQIAARQGTVESLQADLDRMFAMAEKTATDVRAITAAHREVEESRGLLEQVMGRLGDLQDTASALEERNRQMAKAEERLTRADALLVDVRSSLEALQGQKAVVDQAVEKAGSLPILLKQAEATIESLREERRMTAHVRDAVADIGHRDDASDEQDLAKAA